MADLFKKALDLEYFTVGYNIAEAIASIGFGYPAGSIALIGFGLDSIVESLSGGIMVWRLRRHGVLSADEEELAEKKAMRFVAVTFGILGIYVGIESLKKLILIEVPEPSVPGLVIAVLSLITMPILAVRKRAIGREIKSRALIADSNETIACAFLSLALLAGLGGRYFFGFWQADPIAALIIVVFLFHEGYRGWREACNEKSD